MAQKSLQSSLSHPFVELETIRGMSRVARKLAIARKAIDEIREIEKDLLASKGKGNLSLAMNEIASFARSAGRMAGESVELLRDMRNRIKIYVRELGEELADAAH